ncbi:50S ribosomal protein L9 [bacterium]|jgi:large subunit ribosomal protein L9|nr:50S ribosomal protein L9 [bacterium]
MELILRVDIPKLGKAGTIVNVAEGYARNYLLPKKLADKPTQDAKDQIEAIVRRRRIEEAKELEACQEMAKRLEDITVKLARKAGEDEKLFGSVTAKDIADELEAQNVVLDSKKIQLETPIKQLGLTNVEVKLHSEVTASLKVWVVSE